MVALGVLAIAEGRAWGTRLLGAALLVEVTLVGIFSLRSPDSARARLVADRCQNPLIDEVAAELAAGHEPSTVWPRR
jgi:hypothetical protein